jgi:hypothetical protein
MDASQYTQPIILSISPMYIEIRIEVLSQVDLNDLDTLLPLSWTMPSNPIRQPGSIIFDVPTDELARIPYPFGTLVRIVPQTNRLLQPLQPSKWFTAGVETYPSENFSIQCDERGFHQIHYVLSELMYEELILDAFMAYDVLVAV